MPTKPRKHEQLTATLREQAAALKPGDRFPSHTDLMRQYNVSDRTALRSLDDLRRLGLIVRRHGVGTFVADPQQPPPSFPPEPATTTIAALALDFNPFYLKCMEALTSQAIDKGFRAVCQYGKKEVDFAEVSPLEALRPHGFVLFSYTLAPVARRLIEHGHRTVVVGSPGADVMPDVPCVFGDHEQGGYLATRHLLDRGHRRIAFALQFKMSTRTELFVVQNTRRWQGHLRALREAGIEGDASVIDKELFLAWGRDPQEAARFFRRPDAPTGIVTWFDVDARVLLGLLRKAQVRVPDEVSVVGYDNLAPDDEGDVRLTTIDGHIEVMVRNALRTLATLSEPRALHTTVVTPTLVVGETCGPPPRARS